MASILHYLVPGTSNFFVFQKGSRRVEEKGQQSANFATLKVGWVGRSVRDYSFGSNPMA
jgi:hypothetical protein